MKIDLQTGLFSDVRYLPSPNYDERPENNKIDLLVIHNISLPPGRFGTGAVEKFFCNQLDFTDDPYYSTISHLKVASHLFIDRKGSMTQFVPFTKRAWHAGESSFEGRTRCNDFSIGIELEGTDETTFEEKQYQILSEVIQTLMKTYPLITRDRIVGHSHIAPQRKTDPGPFFDWRYLNGLLGI